MKSLTRVKPISFILFLLLSLILFSLSQHALAAKTTAETTLTTSTTPAKAATTETMTTATTTTPTSTKETTTTTPEAVGQMVWVKGDVQAIDANNKTRTLQRRSPIYEHDTIKTGTGSGQIAFTDNSLVALREGTIFRISEYKFNPSSGNEDKYVADVAKGGFRTITGFISKSKPDAYAVRTPVATIGVRGTMFDINYSLTRGLAVKLDKGALFVANQAGVAELDVAKNQIYAETSELNVRPAVTKKPSPLLKGQPALTNSKGQPITAAGVAGVTKTSGSITTKTNTTGTGASATKTKGMEPIPKGTVKSVTGFCIN